MVKLIRLYNTIKYLKAIQIFGRVFYFVKFNRKPIQTFPNHIRDKEFYNFLYKFKFTEDYLTFKFLNETHSINEIGWDNRNVSKLWRYNLHYFEYLLQEDELKSPVKFQIGIIQNWIYNNPYGCGTGWEPYPTSHRIINWIKWHWKYKNLTNNAKISLWNQVRWLEKNLEYQLMGNHLFLNGKALLFAVSFFGLNSNSSIYKKAIKIINSQLDEQFLNDGAHFELSPMYHALAMEDLLDILNISSILPSSDLTFRKIKEKIEKGLRFLNRMSYKNHEFSHFNDCANGIAPTYDKLIHYAKILNIDLEHEENDNVKYFRESGYVVVNIGNLHLIADVGKIGPDYLPGHAHADTLSFELTVNDNRIIVNSGTSMYGNSEKRLYQRSTIAHSTIEIDCQNSSEVWSGFRVARRAYPFDFKFTNSLITNGDISFTCSHNGYFRLKGKPSHTRTWKVKKDSLLIEDEVKGVFNLAISRFYFHPDISITKRGNKYLLSSRNGIDGILEVINSENSSLKKSFYHDEFGIDKSNYYLEFGITKPSLVGVNIQFL